MDRVPSVVERACAVSAFMVCWRLAQGIGVQCFDCKTYEDNTAYALCNDQCFYNRSINCGKTVSFRKSISKNLETQATVGEFLLF